MAKGVIIDSKVYMPIVGLTTIDITLHYCSEKARTCGDSLLLSCRDRQPVRCMMVREHQKVSE